MNPEDRVIDAIDMLVDEQIAGALDRWGVPLDDYSSNRYPDCNICPHDWHGVRCEYCGCKGSTGEVLTSPLIYTDTIERIVITDDRDGRRVNAYTMADLEAMRDQIHSPHLPVRQPEPESPLWVPDTPAPVYLGTVAPRIRFWGVLSEGDNPGMIEGTLELVIDTAIHYTIATIAEICGIPAEALDEISAPAIRQTIRRSTWQLPDQEPLDVESWFGDEIPELPPERQFPRPQLTEVYGGQLDEVLEAYHLSGTAMDLNTYDEARRLNRAEVAQIYDLPEHVIAELVEELPENMLSDPFERERRERREIALAIEVGTDECEQCWRSGEERTGCNCLAPQCPRCGRPMPGVDPADIPAGCIPPICIECAAAL